jgi:hypothetical protein
MRRHQERAVAHHGDVGAVRRRQLGAEDAQDCKAHRRDPQEWINWRGRTASNNWMIQLWCTPTSPAMIAFSGTARISRSGRSGI